MSKFLSVSFHPPMRALWLRPWCGQGLEDHTYRRAHLKSGAHALARPLPFLPHASNDVEVVHQESENFYHGLIGRTTSPLAAERERRLPIVRLRTTAAKRFKKVENTTALVWIILQVAESTFRRLNGADLLPAVYAGAQYVNGVKRTMTARQQIAA